jgi:hypothetical protein
VFAFLLNRGIRGSAALLALFFLFSAAIVYFAPRAVEHYSYPNVFFNYLTGFVGGKAATVLLNFALIAAGGFMLILLSVNEEIVDKQNYFPVFIYLLICLGCVNGFTVPPQLAANVFGTFSLYKILRTYRQENALADIFDAGFWLTFSIYLSIASIAFVPVFFISLVIFRPFYWREWVCGMTGLFVPVFIFECVAYLSEFNQWYIFKAALEYLLHPVTPAISEYFLAFGIMLFIVLFIAIGQNLMHGFGNTVKKQRAKTMLLWMLFFSAINFFLGASTASGILLSYAIPLSIFIGDFLFGIKQVKITNTILVVLMLGCFVILAAKFAQI